jgi:hypothetical protein
VEVQLTLEAAKQHQACLILFLLLVDLTDPTVRLQGQVEPLVADLLEAVPIHQDKVAVVVVEIQHLGATPHKAEGATQAVAQVVQALPILSQVPRHFMAVVVVVEVQLHLPVVGVPVVVATAEHF